MAKAGLQHLQPEVADQARFIIQAQALIDPDVKGQLPAVHKLHACLLIQAPSSHICFTHSLAVSQEGFAAALQ